MLKVIEANSFDYHEKFLWIKLDASFTGDQSSCCHSLSSHKCLLLSVPFHQLYFVERDRKYGGLLIYHDFEYTHPCVLILKSLLCLDAGFCEKREKEEIPSPLRINYAAPCTFYKPYDRASTRYHVPCEHNGSVTETSLYTIRRFASGIMVMLFAPMT